MIDSIFINHSDDHHHSSLITDHGLRTSLTTWQRVTVAQWITCNYQQHQHFILYACDHTLMFIIQGPAWRSQMHQFRSLCLRLDPHPCHHYFLMPHCNNKIYIFESWKNTAHPPIIGAFGHSTDCIVKQPKTATIKIYLYSYNPVLCCHKRNSGLSCRSYMYKQSSTHALENLNFV